MLILVLTLFACGTPAATSPPAPATPPPAAQSPAAPADATSSPGAASASLHGTIRETLSADPYTYARVQLADGTNVWAAAPGAVPAVGSPATVSTSLPMANFHSDKLGRDFPMVYFVETLSDAPSTGTAATPSTAAPASTPAASPASSVSTEKLAAAPDAGAKKVADLWAHKDELGGRKVEITGDVVKYTPGVLGRNWIHLRDGSGADGSNDLTVTSTDATKVGDRVQITGIVALAQDYGAGYTYPVIVTDATVAPAP